MTKKIIKKTLLFPFQILRESNCSMLSIIWNVIGTIIHHMTILLLYNIYIKNNSIKKIILISEWDKRWINSYINENNDKDPNLRRILNIANFLNITALLHLISAKIAIDFVLIQHIINVIVRYSKIKKDRKNDTIYIYIW